MGSAALNLDVADHCTVPGFDFALAARAYLVGAVGEYLAYRVGAGRIIIWVRMGGFPKSQCRCGNDECRVDTLADDRKVCASIPGALASALFDLLDRAYFLSFQLCVSRPDADEVLP